MPFTRCQPKRPRNSALNPIGAVWVAAVLGVATVFSLAVCDLWAQDQKPPPHESTLDRAVQALDASDDKIESSQDASRPDSALSALVAD